MVDGWAKFDVDFLLEQYGNQFSFSILRSLQLAEVPNHVYSLCFVFFPCFHCIFHAGSVY